MPAILSQSYGGYDHRSPHWKRGSVVSSPRKQMKKPMVPFPMEGLPSPAMIASKSQKATGPINALTASMRASQALSQFTDDDDDMCCSLSTRSSLTDSVRSATLQEVYLSTRSSLTDSVRSASLQEEGRGGETEKDAWGYFVDFKGE